jgi:hypothetical protein
MGRGWAENSRNPTGSGALSIHRCSAAAHYGPERTKDGDGSVTTLLVLVILGLIWAAVLVPPYLQNRREHRPGDSIASFRHQLSVLERATPEGRMRHDARTEWAPQNVAYAPVAPARPVMVRQPSLQSRAVVGSARKRRRDVFLTLLAAVPVTFLLAVAMSGMVWMLHLAVDAAFLGYVGLLVKLQQESAEKDLKVRFLEPVPQRSYEQPLLRRVGS